MSPTFHLPDLLATKSLVTHFQPIVNIATRQTVGLEALVRGRHPQTDELIPPGELFAEAKRLKLLLELDRTARETALNSYSKAPSTERPVLFLNIETSILDDHALGSNHLINSILQAGLSPSDIAIEILESRANSRRLIAFTEHYRKLGFLIVIDDFGVSDSNLTRLIDIRPDIIKIDREIVSKIATDPYKRSLFSSVVELIHRNGALCLAEGIETLNDLSCAYMLQADLFQGYHIAKPNPSISQALEDSSQSLRQAIPVIEDRVTRTREENILNHQRLKSIVTTLGKQLFPLCGTSRDERIMMFLDEHPEVACVYLLDKKGRQISSTIQKTSGRGNKLFKPSPIGFDHSLKNYFVHLHSKEEFFSDIYISLATGRPCRTMSLRIGSPDYEAILCVDFESSQTSTAN